MVTAGAELTPGTAVDRRYRIQCVLGRGGFGRTYLAADEQRFNELCVLKEFVPNAQAEPVVAQKLKELFQREAETLHQLDHLQIPQFFAGFEAEERLFIAQEYIDGKTYWRLLQERQRQGCSFSQSEVLAWLQDLLSVLDYLHSQNIVHRDISPDNIMLKRGAQLPVLIDFGVVKQIIPHLDLVNPNDPDDLIQASVSVGKFGYAPYEQIRLGQCSPRSDLYSLAVTAVVLLTGKPPNLLMDAKSLEWRWQRQVRLDPQFVEVLDRMMADKPQERYPSAQAVLQALHPLEPLIKTALRLAPARPPQALRRKLAAQWSAPASTAVEPSQTAGNSEPTIASLLPAASEAIDTVLTDAALTDIVLTSVVLPNTPTGFKSRLGAGFAASNPPKVALVPMQPQALMLATPETVAPPRRHLLALIKAQWGRSSLQKLPQPPQDQLGQSPRSQLTLRRLLALSVLASLPMAGAAVGIRSPHIAPLCWVLSNCAVDAAIESQYQQVIEQADSTGLLMQNARDLSGLQQARQRLADSIAQLSAFSGNLKVYASAHLALPRYQTWLEALDENLVKESRAAQLFDRAEAEAQKATEQTKLAKTYQHYQTAQLEWRRVLATLAAVPEKTFVSAGAAARSREYRTRLDAVGLKLMAMTPKGQIAKPIASPLAVIAAANSSQMSPAAAQSALKPDLKPDSEPNPAANSAKAPPQIIVIRQEAVQPALPQRSTSAQASHPQPSRSRAAAPSRSQSARTPNTSPLQVDRQWVAGSILTSATQTLDNVAIWIDGTRTEADGKFIANLWIQNRSGRGFGFEPLYAELRNDSGQVHRSRVLLTSSAGTMLEPGEGLSGQIYLLDRPGIDKGRLTLVVKESTSGERSFRIPF